MNTKPIKSQDQSGEAFFDTYGYQIIKEIQLPKTLTESSGLLLLDTFLLSFNDSGNEPLLYAVNPSTGLIFHQWQLINTKNKDWEDIAEDDKYIYVGDFGNNFGYRKDLAIYRISKDSLLQFKKYNLVAEKINFSFEDQTNYFPSFYNHSFDCEAMICMNDSLIIFSKDWKNKITTAYTLPKNPGTYTATKRESFDVSCFISGADFSEQDSLLVLTGYIEGRALIWIFSEVTAGNHFGKNQIKHELITLPGIQNEGIVFIRPDEFYLSSEGGQGAARLFHIKIKR